MYVYIELDDHDFHGAGCQCGLCNSNGKSFGAAIYDMTSFGIKYIHQLSYWIQDALKQMDPLDRVYASSELRAIEEAERVCLANNWSLLPTANESTITDDLIGALRGLVGPDGYLTQRGVCECDNTHAQNHTVCRICWARYYYEEGIER